MPRAGLIEQHRSADSTMKYGCARSPGAPVLNHWPPGAVERRKDAPVSTPFIPEPNAADWARLADVELAELVVQLIREIDDDRISDAMYFALDELLERFAPPVAAALQHRGIFDRVDDETERDREVDYAVRRIADRHEIRLAARLVRYRKREGEDA